MIGPRRLGGHIDGEADRAVRWPDLSAAHHGEPPEAAPPPRAETSTAVSRPSTTSSPGGGPAGRRRDWRLPVIESSVTVLRWGLSDFLGESDLSADERYDILLAACEAASNAIEHARSPSAPFFDVLAEIGDVLVTISVCDHGRWQDASAGTYRGRGLAMMRSLADTTLATGPRGTTVTIRSSPRNGRHAVAPHGESGAANGSRCSSPGMDGP